MKRRDLQLSQLLGDSQLSRRRQRALLLPLLAGRDKFVATQHPELGRQIITNQNVLQPVRPILPQPEVRIFKTSVTVSIAHVFTQSIRAGNALQQAANTFCVLRILLPPVGLFVESGNCVCGFEFLTDEVQPARTQFQRVNRVCFLQSGNRSCLRQ